MLKVKMRMKNEEKEEEEEEEEAETEAKACLGPCCIAEMRQPTAGLWTSIDR